MSIPPIGERINPMDVVTGWRVNGGQAKGKKLGHPASAFMTNQGLLDTHTHSMMAAGEVEKKKKKKKSEQSSERHERRRPKRGIRSFTNTHTKGKNKGERSQCETVP